MELPEVTEEELRQIEMIEEQDKLEKNKGFVQRILDNLRNKNSTASVNNEILDETSGKMSR